MNLVVIIIAALFSASAVASTFTPTPGRTVNLFGVIDAPTIDVADAIMKLADGSGKPIDMLIDSPGGSIYAGRVLIQAMSIAQNRGHEIQCVVVRDAASMAFSILAMCSKRYALPEAQMLYHPPRVNAMFISITPDSASTLADELNKMSLAIIDELLSLYPIDRAFFLKHYQRESWHSADDLNAAMPGRRTWIRVIDDIAGLKSLQQDQKGSNNLVNEKTIYQFTRE